MRWFPRSGLRWTILALLIVAFLWFVPQLQGEYFSQKVPAAERPASAESRPSKRPRERWSGTDSTEAETGTPTAPCT
jgi:hypothetical protein